MLLNVRIKYPNAAYDRRNEEMHTVVKTLPFDEPLIDSFSATLLRENSVQGRFYVTPTLLVFYSNVLSYLTAV
jgi:hypothetical protein